VFNRRYKYESGIYVVRVTFDAEIEKAPGKSVNGFN